MSPLRQATRPHVRPSRPESANTVADHRLLRPLYGSPTMWEVKGEDGARYALKLADEFWHYETRSNRRAFRRRLRARQGLNHPNLVTVVGGGESERGPYVLMELPDARPLSELLVDGRLDARRALELLSGVAAALDLANQRRLLHLELSPVNILVEEGETGRALLTDFGVAPEVSPERMTLSPDYRSPEELRSLPPEPASNVYSLACVLYACLTGQPPFVRDSAVGVLYAHCADPPPSLTERRPELPPQVDEIVGRALAKEPEDRPRSARELIAAVGRAFATRDETAARAAPAPASPRAPAPRPVPSPSEAPPASNPGPAPPSPTADPDEGGTTSTRRNAVAPPAQRPSERRETARKPAEPPAGRKQSSPAEPPPRPAAPQPPRRQSPAARKHSPAPPPPVRKGGAPRRKPAAPPPWETWKNPKPAASDPPPGDPAPGNGRAAARPPEPVPARPTARHPRAPARRPPTREPRVVPSKRPAQRPSAPADPPAPAHSGTAPVTLAPPSNRPAPPTSLAVPSRARRSALSGRSRLGLGVALVLAAGAAGWLTGGSASDTTGAERDRAATARAEAAAADVRARNDWRAKTETAITQLDSRRTSGRRLLAAARTRPGQARRADSLAGAFGAAARGVDGAPAGVAAGREVEAALRRTERAYRSLASAARSGRGYGRARVAVNRAEADVRRAVKGLD